MSHWRLIIPLYLFVCVPMTCIAERGQTAPSTASTAEGMRQPLAKGLPPLALLDEQKPWTGRMELRDGMMLKDGKPFFPIGFVFWGGQRALAQARAMGANAMHFEVGWNVSQGPGAIAAGQFASTLDTLRQCSRWGMASFLLLSGHYTPAWFAQKYPSSAAQPLGSDGKITGAWFHYSIHYPPFCKAIADFWRSAAVVLAKEPGVTALAMWNEPAYGGIWNRPNQFADYSQWSVEDYRQWLRDKYKSLQTLRKAHGMAYASFDAVRPPRSPQEMTRSAWLDWMTFGQQTFAAFFAWERGILHAAAPHIPLSIKKIVSPWNSAAAASGINWGLLGASEDIFGLDVYIDSPFFARDVLEGARSYAQGKPVVVYETNVLAGTPHTPQQLRMQLWSQVVGGARGMFIFAMSDDAQYGLLSDKAVNPALRPVYTRFIRDIADHQRELAAPTVPARIAVIYSTTAALQYPGDGVPRHVLGALDLLLKSDYQPDILPQERCTAEGLGAYQAVVVPSYCILKPAELEALRRWVHGGGKVIAFSRSLAMDPYLQPVDPPDWLGAAAQRQGSGEGGDKLAVRSSMGGRVAYCAFESLYSDARRGVIEQVLREQMGLEQRIRLLHEGRMETGIMASLRQDYQDPHRRYLLVMNTLARPCALELQLEPPWRVVGESLLHLPVHGEGNKATFEMPARQVGLFDLMN